MQHPAMPVQNTPAMVEAVKEKQRKDPVFRRTWVIWCDANAGGTKDPSRLSDGHLQRALRECGSTASAGGGRGGAIPELRTDPADGQAYTKEQFAVCYGGYEQWNQAGKPGVAGRGRGGAPRAPYQAGPGAQPRAGQPNTSMQAALAARVRGRQSDDDKFRRAWVQYCDQHTSGQNPKRTKDPFLHTAQFLRQALIEIDGFDAETVSVLSNAVMEYQRQNRDDFRTKWVQFCQRTCNSTCDPRRLDTMTLEAGLRECGADMPGLTVRISQVKQLKMRQKDREWVERWREWCRINAGGALDPAALSPELVHRAAREL
eukprot:TRINITY_DN11782_c0_g1_i1.p1 TRINITY_DN11782_c0_g1~~TRINITY_DN11782_c0_g1_i1.p1  ORF type:complete len:316 (+),score=93.27 TRINITY_DN11782_c0_g1_i1:72-1019(+)